MAVGHTGEKAKRRRKLLKTVRLLRVFVSPKDGRSVHVRITDDVPNDRLGDCTQRKDYYLIRLNKSVIENSPDAVYLVLAHEWAHVIAWESGSYDHGDSWGLAIARCWRVIAGEINAGDLHNVAVD
jgi:hypothetical protein